MRKPKEPQQFPEVRQATLFGKAPPGARTVGTLLHFIVNLLHEANSLLPTQERELLLGDATALVNFLRRDLLLLLQQAEKISLAMLVHDLLPDPDLFTSTIIAPMLRYQRELLSTNATVFAAAERFQFKLLSTKNTFADYPDRGGYVVLVGEFDQIRLYHSDNKEHPRGIPSIIEFKKGLHKGKIHTSTAATLFPEPEQFEEDSVQPTAMHAMQLLVYWLAFQTRWDITEQVRAVRGVSADVPMKLEQPLNMLLYTLEDGISYQFSPTNYSAALLALTECIFYLDWSLKSGYTQKAPDHECIHTQLTALPEHAIQIQVGNTAISAQECYQLAREAFERFQATIRWNKFPG